MESVNKREFCKEERERELLRREKERVAGSPEFFFFFK
jgi:hypothetical protein